LSSHPEQGWSLLCNGVILFEDTGELLPDRSTVLPHRGCAGKAYAGVSRPAPPNDRVYALQASAA
jgi:uncharacterized protein DUF5999